MSGTRSLRERLARAALTGYRYAPRPLQRAAQRMFSPAMTVGAAAVLRRGDGKVLLVKQRHTGAWALPGGLVRRGEMPAQAAAREVAEEVGIAVDPATLGEPRVVFDPMRRAIDFVYAPDADSTLIAHRTGEAEITRFGWFDVAALPEVTAPTVAMLQEAVRGRLS